MWFKIPSNTTQEEFEELLRQNSGLKELDCSFCPLLTNVPNIEGLETLDCYNCPLLTNVPNIEGLKKLDCSCCPRLTNVPNIEGLEILYCSGCPLLTNVPNIEGLKKLNCRSCPLLTINNIGYLPSLIEVSTDFPNFKERQLYLHKLSLIRPNIQRKLGKYAGFTNDLMRMLETY